MPGGSWLSASAGSAGSGAVGLETDAEYWPGAREIRIHTAVEHRVCYVAKFEEAIYVLHAFEKRTRKTSRHEVELARQRYQALIAQR